MTDEINAVTGLPQSITDVIKDASFKFAEETKYGWEFAPEKVNTPELVISEISALKQDAYMMGMAAGYKIGQADQKTESKNCTT